jgi:hypothetical protein
MNIMKRYYDMDSRGNYLMNKIPSNELESLRLSAIKLAEAKSAANFQQNCYSFVHRRCNYFVKYSIQMTTGMAFYLWLEDSVGVNNSDAIIEGANLFYNAQRH